VLEEEDMSVLATGKVVNIAGGGGGRVTV